MRENSFPDEELSVVEDLLQESDLVKFARYKPSEEEISRHDQCLDSLLERTKPEQVEDEDEDEEEEEEEEEEVALQ